VELRRFFGQAVGASFRDLGLDTDDPVSAYLADLLTRFARTERLFPPGLAVSRLETVVDILLDAQAAWQGEGAAFRPEREVAARRHLGDFTLFMTGIFPERVERVADTGYYVVQGKRAYRFVAEHDRASSRPRLRAVAPVYGRLSERFEHYAGALDYARRVHFHDAPPHPFFGLTA
jgi:hypothetical protein